MQRPEFSELVYRLQMDIDHAAGILPERVAIAWAGYYAALLEWDLISRENYFRLADMLPELHDNPAGQILAGR